MLTTEVALRQAILRRSASLERLAKALRVNETGQIVPAFAGIYHEGLTTARRLTSGQAMPCSYPPATDLAGE
jgi:hypothetical protein